MSIYKDMHNILEEGQVGGFTLEKFEITKENRPLRCSIPDGKYIQLLDKNDRWNEVIMSNTPMEMRTNREFVESAHGDVFIAGLGIGMIVLPIQENSEIKSITILEKNKEIIELVGKQLPLNSKVKIIEGDVFNYEFSKDTKFDCIYFDIWNFINSDVYEEMKVLKKKYKKYCKKKKENPKAFIKCWAEYEAKLNLRLY